MCDCFHLAFPNWHAASSGTGPGRRLRGPEPGAEDDSICDEPSQFTEGERPRPQGSSPVEEFPEIEKYSESDKECEAEHDPHHKSGSGKKTKKSGLGSMFEKRSTPKMSKLKEVPSPESGVIVKTAEDGCAEGLVYGGGGKEGIFIKQVVPESPASKSLKLKEGDQILSATVYFDNMSYEDAMQIMEHAQAYRMKLCLKRKPDITETEPVFESDVIPEDDIYPPAMREQGKTKRRGDARISWPKFPSFGKGKKSRFTRSHSSSEADEQRKLELSPTTSDTESPIKSQDALKGKKRHKLKLSSLKKRGRISSSEDQDTDTPTTGQISGKILETHETSDMLSPECLESPPGETPEVYMTKGLKVVEELRPEQNDQILSEPQTVQHKVELITLDTTLKTEDLTVALAEKEISDTKSPDGKKKKKERSELKMKILGKDKSKKDAKAKSSPKRLKTLGASLEIPDQPVIPGDQLTLDKTVTTDKEMSVPKVELDISDVTLMRKSPKEGEEKTKKDKDIKQKQEVKTGPAFKLPKVGFGDFATEETIQKIHVNVEESTTKIEVREDPYEQLSKSGLSRTQLPKREEIEIPGMEDKSRTKVKRPKEPKVGLMGHREAETVQMSIDVDSVKEAVSKLPGYKLPKVDMSGVPIPEDIIVIDANAQRISVKTPTKVVDTKKKHEAHFGEFDITASPEISNMTVKQPKMTPDLTSEELIIETKVHVKTPEKKVIQTEVFKREDIVIPGKESIQEVTILQAQDKKSKKTKMTTASFGIAKPDIKIPDIGFDLPKQKISKQEGDIVKTEGTVFIQEVKTTETETRKGKGQIGEVISGVKVPEIDGIEYIDSVGDSSTKKEGDRLLTGFGVSLDVAKPHSDISIAEIRAEVKDASAKAQALKLPKSGEFTADISANIPDVDKDMSVDAAETYTFEREGKGRKFKMPNLDISMPKVKGSKIDSSQSKKDVGVTLPGAKAEVKLPDLPTADVTLGNIHVSISEQKMDVEKPELEIKPLTTSEYDVQGDKFKVPKFGIKTPKIKGPEFDLSVSKKDVKVPDVKAEGKLPQTSETDVTLGGSVVPIQQQKMTVKKAEVEIKPVPTDEELHGQGSRFKMPKLGITMPKVRGPEIDLSKSKKDTDVTLPEAKAEVKLPEVELKEPSAEVEVKAPEIKLKTKNTEGSPSKFKMPTFKLPKFGVGSPNVSMEVRDMDKDVTFDRTDTDISVGVPTGKIEAPSTDFEGPSIDMETIATDHEGKGSMFKKPHFGFSMPKVKGPQMNLSLSQKDVDVTTPDTNVEGKLPEAPKVDVSLGRAEVILPEEDLEVKMAEIKMKHLQSEAELDGQGNKFKMPKLGMSMPKVKGPEIHFGLSKKDGDLTLSEAKAEAKVTEVEIEEPSADVEIKAPEIKVTAKGTEGSPSKFKMPSFKLPKFGVGTPNISVKVPEVDKDVKIDGADINIPEEGSVVMSTPNVDIEGPSIDIKSTGTELDGKGGKFKMPTLGFSMPKVKGPKVDLSLSKKDVDVTLPEAKTEVTVPEVDLGKVDVSIPEAKIDVPDAKLDFNLPDDHKIPEMDPSEWEAEMDGHGGKFKMPKFGIKMPKVKGPEFDFSLSKKDRDVKSPESKAGVNLPEVDLGKVDVSTPDVKKPELEMQSLQIEGEFDGKEERFKIPKFGIKMPKVKGPEFDLSKTGADGTKLQTKLPDAPKLDVTLGKAEGLVPEVKAEVEKPELKIKPLQTEVEGQGSRFKVPTIGMAVPKVKGPEFHLGFSKKDVDVTLPEAKADVKLKESSATAEIKAPEIEVVARDTDVSSSKFKMPTLSVSMPKVKGDIHLSSSKKGTDITLPGTKADFELHGAPKTDVSLGKAEVLIPKAKVEVQKPEVEIKPLQTDVELDGQGGKFKMPTFGITMPKVKGPEIDFSLSKKDKDVRLPEAKAEVKIPEAPKIAMDIKAPECEAEIDGQEGKFKVPKFGMSLPKVKGPDIDLSLSKKDKNVTLPEATVDVSLPDAELKEPSAKVEIKAAEIDAPLSSMKGSPSKFKMPTFKFPKFGVATPNISAEVPDKDVKIDGADMSISVPHTDVDVPKVKAEIHLPEVEVKEPSGGVVIVQPPGVELDAKVKKPRFSLPRFSFSKPSVKSPEADVSLPDVNIMIPEGKVEIKGGEVDMKPPECEAEVDGHGSKFKMPKFGITMPKVTGPEIDLSLSKKDVDVTLPEAKAEVNLPDIDMKQPSAEVEVKAPEIKLEKKDTKGSALKFKMPTFDLPKFGVGTPSDTIEVPDADKDVKIDGADFKIPEEVLAVHIAAPSIDTEGPSIHMKTTGSEHEGKGGKFKMPSLGFSGPTVKGPDIDLSLSKKDVDVTLPEAKAEVKLPEAELKEPSADVEVKAPEIKVTAKNTEGSPSKFKMPSFKLPKFGAGIPSATIEVPDTDKDVKIDGGDISISGPHIDADVPDVKAEVHLPEVDVKEPLGGAGIEQPLGVEVDAKMKKPRFSLPRFSFSKPSVKAPELDVSLPDVNVAVPEGKMEVKGGEVDMKPPECEAEVDGSKFKMPKFGVTMPKVTGPEIDLRLSKKNVDVTLPDAKAEVKLPDVDLKEPSAEVKIEAPEIKIERKDTKGQPSKFKMPTFELPKLGAGTPKANVEVPNVDKDIKTDGADIKIPEKVLKVDIAAPSIETEAPSIHMKMTGPEHEGKGSKFRMPSLGFSGPTFKGPDIDLSLSKKDIDVTLPEAKAEVRLPEVELKEPSAEIEVKAPEIKVKTKNTEGSPSKFKMPSFKLPKFGAGIPSATVELPDTEKDVKIDGADIKIPEEVLTVQVATPSIDTEVPSIHMKTTGPEHEGKGGKFKMPSLGFSGPTVKRPEIDLSLSKKDIDVTLPEAKAEVKLPEVELKEPSAEVEVKAPEIKVKTKNTDGSPSKFKMPSFKMPKFGGGTPSATIEVPDTDKDIQIDGADIKIPEEVLTVDIAAPRIETEVPSIHMKMTGPEHEGKGGKFKMPSLGFSGPTVKGPDIDLSLSKKDVNVTLPEAKAEVKLPEVELKEPSVEVQVKAPEIKVKTKNTDGSPSKFKMPSFKLPKFGAGTPSATMEVPDTDTDIKIEGADIKIPEEVLTVDIAAPRIETEDPSIHMKMTGPEHEGKGGKFKMPSLGFSGPAVKQPDIDLSLSKKDVNVTLPEAKAEVKLPEVELKEPSVEVQVKAPEIKVKTKNTDGSPSKFKMPSFKLPKFGGGTPSATIEVPDTDTDIKIDGADIKIPEEVLTVDIAAPRIETEGPSIHMKMTGPEHEGKGGKFKMPSLGFSGPAVKQPDIDLSLSKKDVNVTLPEAKAEVKLPEVELKEPSAEVQVKVPEIKIKTKNTEVSPSKFKMPSFKLPKFGAGTPSATIEVPDADKDVKIDGADIKIPEEVLTVNIAAPSIETEVPSIHIKTTGPEHEGKGGKFKMPSLGFSGPTVKRPDIDLNLSKKDIDVTLPEAKTEVKLPEVELKEPSAEAEVKAPEIKVKTKNTEGSPSKFKMPSFKLPKFGAGTPSATIEVPDADKDVKIDGAEIKIPEEVLTVQVATPRIETEVPSIHIKTTGPEHEGKGGKFKMPSLGFSGPTVKRPDIDLSLSKKDVDVTLPEAKATVQVPDIELKESSAKVEVKAPGIDVQMSNVDGSPSKYKMPTFKLPKFGATAPQVSVEVPDVDKDIKIDGAKLEVSKDRAKVDVTAPSIDKEGLSVDVKAKGGEVEGSGSKFKMPKFGISVPKVKGPEIDLSLSKKDTDVKLPEPKAEVQVPDVKVKQPSGKVEIKAQAGSVEGSPSKLKMPTFTLPKFGASTPKVSVEVPDMDKDIKIDGAKLEVSKEGATVDITAPSIDTEGLSVDMKAKGSEVEGSSSRFKMPKFGISMPKVQGPEIDLSLSKKDTDVTIPEAKAEVKLPKAKEPEGALPSLPDAPTVEVETKVRRPSWAFPTFSFSRTSSKASDVDVNLETPKVDVTVPEAKAEVSLPDVEVQGPTGAISMEEPPAAELDPNLKKTKFSLPRLSFSKSGGKAPAVSAELPHVDVSLPEGEVVVKQPDVELKPGEGDVQIDGQGSKFKMPKFGISMPKVKGPEIDLSLSKKDAVIKLPEEKMEVQLPDVKMKQPSAKVEIKAPEVEAQAGNVIGSPSKLKMPTFTLPKFGASSAKVSVEGPDVDKDIKIDGAKLEVSKKGATVDVTAPSIDTEGLSVDVKAKGKELEETGSKFKMPKFGISLPKVQGPEIDLSLSKKDVDVTTPEAKAEVKLPKVKEAEGAISLPDAPTVEVESKVRRPSWAFPTFSFSRTSSKASDVDVNLETPRVDVTVPEAKAEVSLPDVEVQGPTGAISMEEPPAAELDANLKKTTFSLPRLSFSKSGGKAPAVSAELPHVDVSLPEGQVVVKQIDVELKPGEGGVQIDGQGSKFKMPKFGIDLKASQKKVDITLPEVEAEVKLPETKVKSSASVKGSESDAKSKDVGGSPLKFKMPTMKMQKSGSATYDVTVEAPDLDKAAETDGSKVKADVSVNIKGPSLDIKTDVSNAAVTDTDTPKTETDSVVLGSPSKFKLPSFKMPRMSFSKPKPEDEHVPVEIESKEHQLKIEVEPKEEMKSPKLSLTTFGEILKNIDVEFDVSKADKEEVNLETSKDVHETDEKQLEPKEKETNTKQETVKSPERTGWFKFPRFGLSSPSEPAKTPEKDEHKDEKSPAGETADEELSPTCSVQSSDAFADISSAMTSEHAGLSLSSPTKVTVKYSDPTITTGLGETHTNVITSTTRTEVISVEPNLPEKITILSSGVSSSSEDTLQLASGKIHVITSNIQATPTAQQAKLLTDVQIQSAGDFPLKSESNEGASMTIEESPSGIRSLFGRHFFRETSSETSESKETIVITKQITHVIESSEPISGETASSIQRLKDSVHSDKMRFFDGAKK